MLKPLGRQPPQASNTAKTPTASRGRQASSSAEPVTQPQGWTSGSRITGPARVAGGPSLPSQPKPNTFSEVLQAFNAIANDSSLEPRARAQAVEQLQATVTAMGIGSSNPFRPLVNCATADALKLSGLQRLNYLAGQESRKALDRLNGALGPPMPAVPTRIPFDGQSAGKVGGSNALLSAQVVTGAYAASKERILSMMSGQFDSAKVVDGAPFGPLGGRAVVGTRSQHGEAMTMIGIRGTNNSTDAVRDVMMGCVTMNARGGPCFKLKDGADGYGAGAVHVGFAQHLDTLWPSLRCDILDAARHNRTVVITGHSLGAATAELAMARAVNDPEIAAALKASTAQPKAVLETFAQPAVGDAAFEKDFKGRLDALGIPFHTYGFRNDPVMQVPPTGLPDVEGRMFARPCGEFAELDSGPNGATLSRGRPAEDVAQKIRTGDLASFVADVVKVANSASSSAEHGYSKLADHAPQNYWGALLDLAKRGS